MRAIVVVLLLSLVACSKNVVKMTYTTPQVAPESTTAPSLLEGIYTLQADAGYFAPCMSDLRYLVVHEADVLALEHAYAQARPESGAPMFVTLYGHIEARPVADGKETRDMLVVDRFVRVWPEEVCEKSDVNTTLDNTYWKLVELEGDPVQLQEAQREPYLILRANNRSVGGFAGCNNLTGTYDVKGDSLSFGKLASTLMACPHMDAETAFTRALERVRTYLIQGESLDLRDGTESIARFRAVYLR